MPRGSGIVAVNRLDVCNTCRQVYCRVSHATQRQRGPHASYLGSNPLRRRPVNRQLYLTKGSFAHRLAEQKLPYLPFFFVQRANSTRGRHTPSPTVSRRLVYRPSPSRNRMGRCVHHLFPDLFLALLSSRGPQEGTPFLQQASVMLASDMQSAWKGIVCTFIYVFPYVFCVVIYVTLMMMPSNNSVGKIIIFSMKPSTQPTPHRPSPV